MKKKILTTAILLTGLISASTYHYTFKISDTSLFNNSQQVSNGPTMQDATPQERTGIQSTGKILASDGGVDWYGEVSAANLISGNELASLIGLTAGVSINSDAGWLHVGIDGKEIYIAKKPFRSHLRKFDLGNAFSNTITINNNTYLLRLIRGGNQAIVSANMGYDIHNTVNSEWNRIMYRLTRNTYLNNANIKNTLGTFENLANYTETDLVLDRRTGLNGSATIIEERNQIGNTFYRGYEGVSYIFFNSGFDSLAQNGWRPVLEKVN